MVCGGGKIGVRVGYEAAVGGMVGVHEHRVRKHEVHEQAEQQAAEYVVETPSHTAKLRIISENLAE